VLHLFLKNLEYYNIDCLVNFLIYLFEIFTSKQAMDSYQAKPRFQAFLKRAMPMLQAREEVLLTPLSFQTQSNLLEQTK